MPETVRARSSLLVGGVTYEQVLDLEGSSIERASPTVPAGKSGTLTTRTDDNTGIATLESGHGITTGQKVALFWADGKRYGMDATVSGTAVTLDGGSGDALPVTTTAVVAMVPAEVAFVVDGDEDLKALAAQCSVEGYIEVLDDAETPASIVVYDVGSSNSKLWHDGNGITNPLAGKVTSLVKFAHGSTAARTMTLLAVFGA